ncbi:hypothetical protein EON83_12800 [bacterium]|nr:MAG: hypothetical protein EON83_12800 [bacterium]
MPLEKLGSLTEQANPTIKYFSGTAMYNNTLAIPANALGIGKHLFLRELAQVTLNGHDLGKLWSAPFVIDITKVVRAENNELKVRVTNAWHNRLVGEALKP